MKTWLTIVTVHKGDINELRATVDSIYKNLDTQFEHIVVARVPENEIELLNFICNRSKLVINQDKSLYDAMNIGLNNANGKFISFVNSGDLLCACVPIGELNEDTCFSFKPRINIDGQEFVSRRRSVNHQNFIALTDKKILFDEAFGVFADANWMRRMSEKYDIKYSKRTYAVFHYGGISTRPSLDIAFSNMKCDRYVVARVKLLIKAILIVIGLESINKLFLLKSYK